MRKEYLAIQLHRNNIVKDFPIHRLVAIHFIPNPESKPCINHIDGNKLNNHVNNLEWCTIAENNKHMIETGLWKGPQKIFSNNDIEEIKELYKMGHKKIRIAERYRVARQTIYKILNNTYK